MLARKAAADVFGRNTSRMATVHAKTPAAASAELAAVNLFHDREPMTLILTSQVMRDAAQVLFEGACCWSAMQWHRFCIFLLACGVP